MSAIWLYLPPIILLATLVGLAVLLGKKTAAIKKFESLKPKSRVGTPAGNVTGKGERLKRIGHGSLRALEAILYYIKIAFRKLDESSANWLKKLRERRLGQKMKDISPQRNEEMNPPDLSDGEITFISESASLENLGDTKKETGFIPSEVIIRKKVEAPPLIIKEKPAEEDKVKEDALIHRIAENPKDMEAYREIGDYYLSIGNIKDAKESFKMVLRLRPRDLKAKSSLKEIEMKMRLGN
jgi:tetratricopeptide (TPR) repeat protein